MEISAGQADVVGLDKYGNLWLYPGQGAKGKPALGAQVKLATGLGSVQSIVAPGDLNGNGINDILVQSAGGIVTFYPGAKDAAANYMLDTAHKGEAIRLSSTSSTLLPAGDWDGDAHPDLYVRDGGTIQLLKGTGNGTLSPVAVQTCGTQNWSQFQSFFAIGDVGGKGVRLAAHEARAFTIAGRNGVPAQADAVTINVTVTGQTSPGNFAVGPGTSASTNWSTLNFPGGGVGRAASTTVGLADGGMISVLFDPASDKAVADVIVDVTGYFLRPNAGGSPAAGGSFFVALPDPVRFVDSRPGSIHLVSVPRLQSTVAQSFQVAGMGGVPSNATAVVGTLTVTNQSSAGNFALTPAGAVTSASSLNFSSSGDLSNNATVAIGTGGKLTVQFSGSSNATADVVFDVVGYYAPATASGAPPAGGMVYKPLATPQRLLDSRYADATRNPSGLRTFHAGAWQSFQVAGQGSIGADALAVTGTATLVSPTQSGYLAVGASEPKPLTWSTVNAVAKDVVANGVAVTLSTGNEPGRLHALYNADPGNTANVIFDVTGYYTDAASHSGDTYVPLPDPVRMVDTRSDEAVDIVGVDSNRNLWINPGGCGTPYRLPTYMAFSWNGPSGSAPAAPPESAGEDISSVAGPLPGVTDGGDGAVPTVALPYAISEPGDGGAVTVDMWVRYASLFGDKVDWSYWYPAGSATSSPASLQLDYGDGLYEVYTVAKDESGNEEYKVEAETNIWLTTEGRLASRLRALSGAYTNTGTIDLSFDYVLSDSGSPLAKVDLYRRYRAPGAASPGSWGSPIKTWTGDFGSTFTFSAGAEGTYEFKTVATDQAGVTEVKTLPDQAIYYDKTAPASSIDPISPATAFKQIDLSTKVTEAGEGSGLDQIDLYYRTKATSQGAWSSWEPYGTPGVKVTDFIFAFLSVGYYEFYTAATDAAGNEEPAPEASTPGKASTYYGTLTWHALNPPVRVFRSDNPELDDQGGATSKLMGRIPREFHVAGRGGIPSGAVAVTGTLTVFNRSSAGNVALGPTETGSPDWATINFPSGNVPYSAGVTTALSPDGTLYAVFAMPSTASVHALFDVTGYFDGSATGATYYPLPEPKRVADSRKPGGITKLSAGVAQAFSLGSSLPSDAIAVTGTLIVTGQNYGGYFKLGPDADWTQPPWSVGSPRVAVDWTTLSFPATNNYSTGVTVAVGADHKLRVMYVAPSGKSAHVLFDMTGYFRPGTGGATYYGLDSPVRVLRSGFGPTPKLSAKSWYTFSVPVPNGMAGAPTATTGTLTVAAQQTAGYLALGAYPASAPSSTGEPSWSSLNFPTGNAYSADVTSKLSATGGLSVVYWASSGTADFMFDCTGFYGPPPQ